MEKALKTMEIALKSVFQNSRELASMGWKRVLVVPFWPLKKGTNSTLLGSKRVLVKMKEDWGGDAK